MRKFSITLMFSIAALTICFGIFLFSAEPRGVAYWLPSSAPLLAISFISLIYAARLTKTNSKSAKVQITILLSYLVTLAATAIIGSSSGSIPYIMQSMEIDFITALKHIWPTLLLSAVVATASCVFAHVLVAPKAHSPNAGL